MVAADLNALSLLDLRWVELVHDQPRARRLARRVWAVPVLEHHAPEAETGERLAPRAQAARHVRGEPDVRARRHETLEVPLSLEQRHAVEDRRAAVGLRLDRVEELARAVHRPVVTHEARPVMTDPDEDPGPLPG